MQRKRPVISLAELSKTQTSNLKEKKVQSISQYRQFLLFNHKRTFLQFISNIIWSNMHIIIYSYMYIFRGRCVWKCNDLIVYPVTGILWHGGPYQRMSINKIPPTLLLHFYLILSYRAYTWIISYVTIIFHYHETGKHFLYIHLQFI